MTLTGRKGSCTPARVTARWVLCRYCEILPARAYTVINIKVNNVDGFVNGKRGSMKYRCLGGPVSCDVNSIRAVAQRGPPTKRAASLQQFPLSLFESAIFAVDQTEPTPFGLSDQKRARSIGRKPKWTCWNWRSRIKWWGPCCSCGHCAASFDGPRLFFSRSFRHIVPQ